MPVGFGGGLGLCLRTGLELVRERLNDIREVVDLLVGGDDGLLGLGDEVGDETGEGCHLVFKFWWHGRSVGGDSGLVERFGNGEAVLSYHIDPGPRRNT